jgi:hypothetical protein
MLTAVHNNQVLKTHNHNLTAKQDVGCADWLRSTKDTRRQLSSYVKGQSLYRYVCQLPEYQKNFPFCPPIMSFILFL